MFGPNVAALRRKLAYWEFVNDELLTDEQRLQYEASYAAHLTRRSFRESDATRLLREHVDLLDRVFWFLKLVFAISSALSFVACITVAVTSLHCHHSPHHKSARCAPGFWRYLQAVNVLGIYGCGLLWMATSVTAAIYCIGLCRHKHYQKIAAKAQGIAPKSE